MVIISLVSITGYFLLRDHQSHLLQALPYMILLLCPLMHIFMHGSHGGHEKHDESESEAYRRGLEEGRSKSEQHHPGA
jgi:hypothetical protein